MLISVSVEPEAVAKASGVFSVIGGIGGLIAPVFMGNTATVLFGKNSPSSQFTVAFTGMLLLGLVMLAAVAKNKN